MVASAALLFMAQRSISMGTAYYAVWTGIGTVGTLLLGIWLFGEPATLVRFMFVGLTIAGILGLRFASSH
jgi:quaternary ammonium compound-resistance protein SugE